MSFFVMTVTVAGVDSIVSGTASAVTTIVALVLGGACAKVRVGTRKEKRRMTVRFTTTSLRSW
jgi:hypothetical protein